MLGFALCGLVLGRRPLLPGQGGSALASGSAVSGLSQQPLFGQRQRLAGCHDHVVVHAHVEQGQRAHDHLAHGVYLAEVARQLPLGLAGVATGGTLAFTFFGVVLGPPVFGALSGVFQTYRAGYLALAVPTALCCVALLRARQLARPLSTHRRVRSLAQAWCLRRARAAKPRPPASSRASDEGSGTSLSRSVMMASDWRPGLSCSRKRMS